MSDLAQLLAPIEPLSPEHTINEVAEILLAAENRRFLCLPVVDQGRPIGTVSRNHLQSIFMSMYGRDLYGKNPVTKVMNVSPLTVEVAQPMEKASQYITANIQYPITEDFVITRSGAYHGMGFVIDLLSAMERRVAERNLELAKAYRSLKESQSQLVQSEKMASLGQMVAGVAHEINTPLGYVKNNVAMAHDIHRDMAELMAEFKALLALFDSDVAEEAEVAQRLLQVETMAAAFEENFPQEDVAGLYDDTLYGIEQISEMVINLKNFSRLDQATVSNVSVNECIDSALVIAKNVIKHKAEAVREYGDIPMVSCSPSQINQVFLNLLTNAAQAIEDFGRITIRTWAEGGYVHASVQDNGKGIEPKHLKKIFDPFFTTKPVGKGTGLGLSITFKILQQHKGKIRVGSEPGKGSRFVVSLPVQNQLLKEAM